MTTEDIRKRIVEVEGGNPIKMSLKSRLTMRSAATLDEQMNETPPRWMSFKEKAEYNNTLQRLVTPEEFEKIHSGEEAGINGVIDAPLPGTSLVNRIKFYTDDRVNKAVKEDFSFSRKKVQNQGSHNEGIDSAQKIKTTKKNKSKDDVSL